MVKRIHPNYMIQGGNDIGSNGLPSRKLQVRQIKNQIVVVDKETQQPIDGVVAWEIEHKLDLVVGREMIKAVIKIEITGPLDVIVGSDEVEGSIADVPLALPEPEE